MVHVRIDGGDARGHGEHRLDGIAAFGEDGAAVLDSGQMRRADDAAAMSGGVQRHASDARNAATENAAPAASKAMPMPRRQNFGCGSSFSAVTSTVNPATQRRSMTATANSSTISAAQQPMQNRPWRKPMIAAPSAPSRHSLKMKPSGERQRLRQRSLSGLNW